MSQPIQIRNHPFRFLLYLEWILLVIAVLIEALPARHPEFPQFRLLTLLSITGFGLMGLRLPTGAQIYKLLYTSLEIGLLVLAAVVGRGRLFPFLYLILVIRSCLLFELPGRLMVTGLAFALFLLTLFRRVQNAPFATQERLRFIPLSFTLSFGLVLVFVLLLMNAVLTERKSREKLAIAHAQLRQYALRVEDQATLQERNRIARDIHDSLGHSLTALNLQLEGALKLWHANPAKAQGFLTEAKRLSAAALREVRQSVSALRSNPLQGRSLETAIASLAEELQRGTSISPDCQINLAQPLPIEMSTAVYRIVQEALTNIYKHGAATEVHIQLSMTLVALCLVIQDNGKGFRPDQNTTGFGLQSMRERAMALGGHLDIDSAPAAGCKIMASIPLPRLPQ